MFKYRHPFVHLGGERHCGSKVTFLFIYYLYCAFSIKYSKAKCLEAARVDLSKLSLISCKRSVEITIIYYFTKLYLLSLATERTFKIIQIQSPEHGTKEIFSFDQSIHLQYQTRPVVKPHPLITDVSIRGSHCIVLYHCQTHLTYLVIGQEPPFSSVLPRGSLSSGWRSKSILARVG